MMKTLRPYQADSVAAVRKTFDASCSCVLVLPTGTGKTVVMAKLSSEWARGNVLLLAHRVELLDQAADKLESELGYRPVVEQAQRCIDPECLWQGGLVLVGSVATMRSDERLEKFKQYPFDLILIDECHHATAPSYRKIVDYFLGLNPQCKILGVTATPRRADNTALGAVFKDVAYQLGIQEAVNDGWLVPVQQEFADIQDVSFDGLATGKNDFGESDFRAADMESVLIEEEPLHGMARAILERAGDKQTIIFNAGVQHAHLMADVLNRPDYKPESAAAVDGETRKEKRREIVQAFSAGKLQFLCNFGVFTEGFDCPPVALVAMGRPTKSVGLYTQMLGRGMRPLDGIVDGWGCAEDRKMAILTSNKPHLLVLDFVGNSQHKLVSSYDVLGGNYDLEAIALAKERSKGKPDDVADALKKAQAEKNLERYLAQRRHIKAQVDVRYERVDPFGHGAPAPEVQAGTNTRGGASDAQVGFLVNLGVDYATAAGYTKRQASAVIEKLKATRCTAKQKATLARFGEDTSVNFEQAKAVIDAIANNGWKPRAKGGE